MLELSDFEKGKVFNSFKEFDDKIQQLGREKFHFLVIKDSHKIKTDDEELKSRIVYNDVQMACVHYGENDKAKSLPGKTRVNTKSLIEIGN